MKRSLSKLTALLLIAALLLPMAGVAESFAAGETPAELFEQPVAEEEYDLMAPELSEGEAAADPAKEEKAPEADVAEPDAAPKSAVKMAPKKVSLGMKTLTIGVKETVQLQPKIAKNTAASFTWKTSNKKIVTVTNKGKIKGRKAGKATVTVTTHNGEKAKVTVTVKAAPKKVTLSAKSATLEVGKTLQLKATLPKNTASYKRTWKSSDASVATVNGKGVVTAVKAGTATITVTTFNKKKATCTVTVKPTAGKEIAGTLVLGQATDAVIAEAGQTVKFGFVPGADGFYVFSSTGDELLSSGYLYDAAMNEITHEEDNEDENFRITRWLRAGTQYYYGVRYINSTTGTISVMLSAGEGLMAEPVGSGEIRVAPGGSATLEVVASGAQSYRWYRYDNDYEAILIDGATGASYTTGAVTEKSQYRCLVSDKYGNGINVWFDVYIDN